MFVLIYVGDGGGFPDVPARSLTADDLAAAAVFGWTDVALIATGLYRLPDATPTPELVPVQP